MIFESLLIHFSDFSRFSGSPSANFRKNREIGRIQTPLRILGEHPWNRRVECESGRFTDFWGFSQAPHQQISGKIEESAGSKLHSAFWANIHEFPMKIGGDLSEVRQNLDIRCWERTRARSQHLMSNVKSWKINLIRADFSDWFHWFSDVKHC